MNNSSLNLNKYNRLILIEYNKYLNAYICLIYCGSGKKIFSIKIDEYKIGNLIINNFLPLKFIFNIVICYKKINYILKFNYKY